MNEDKRSENGNGLSILAEEGLLDSEELNQNLLHETAESLAAMLNFRQEQILLAAPSFITPEMKEDVRTVMRILITTMLELNKTTCGKESAACIGGIATLFLINPLLISQLVKYIAELCPKR